MIATADSSVKRAICTTRSKLINNILIDGPVDPKRVKRRWPAIIFAANRTAKVPGRIKFLIVSIQTIKGIKMLGVPCGTKWANIWLVWLIHPYSINLIHKGNAKDKVKVIWLVLVKIYGNNPMKLLKTILENSLIKMNVLPICLFDPNKVLNSLWSVIKIFFHKKENRLGITQYI